MPRGDRTASMGGMTGRAAGYCAGFGMAGYEGPAAEHRFGRRYFRDCRAVDCGFGGRRGWRNWLFATDLPRWMRFGRYATSNETRIPFQKPDPEIEKQALKNRVQILQAELASIEKRLTELDAETEEKKA
jgi:hypothetical protein